MDYYWLLKTRDGKEIFIPPAGVDVVKRRMADGQPINTRTNSIPPNQIISFDLTDKPYNTQPLLEAAAQAFNDPVLDDTGAVMCRWVKKSVTHDRWNRYYSLHPYKKISDDGAMVTIAFRLPIHGIDVNITAYCTDEEIAQIERRA